MPSVITSLHVLLCIMALAPSPLAAPTPRAVDLDIRTPHQQVTPPPPANQNTAKAPSDALVSSSKAVTAATTTTTKQSPTPSATTKPSQTPSAIITPPLPIDLSSLPAADGASGGPVITTVDDSSDCALNRGGCNPKPRSADETAIDGIPPPPIFEVEDDDSDSSQNRGGSDVAGG